jgi:short-subunit dehydrogenase
VLITGASSGLGEEMARQFADLGHDLALCARRTDRLGASRPPHWMSPMQRRCKPVFRNFADRFGVIYRVVVNAGIGHGAALGTGHWKANQATAITNFVGALSQTEAVLEIFRGQGHGHLVLISSISALRGMRKSMTTYAATKAGVASMAEGLRSERIKGLDISVIYPGYIRLEMTAAVEEAKTRFMVDTQTGVKAMVTAIEKHPVKAYVPAWPWVPLAAAMKVLPLSAPLRGFDRPECNQSVNIRSHAFINESPLLITQWRSCVRVGLHPLH